MSDTNTKPKSPKRTLLQCIRGAAATEYLTTVGGALVIGYGLYHFATKAKAKITSQGDALGGIEATLPKGGGADSSGSGNCGPGGC